MQTLATESVQKQAWVNAPVMSLALDEAANCGYGGLIAMFDLGDMESGRNASTPQPRG